LEEKEEREKNRAEVMELTDGRDGEQCGYFRAPTKWVMRSACHLQQKTKGYPTLVSSFNAYNKQNARNWVSDDTTIVMSCHLRAMSPPPASSRSTVFM
jgi:hypothetical protein